MDVDALAQQAPAAPLERVSVRIFGTQLDVPLAEFLVPQARHVDVDVLALHGSMAPLERVSERIERQEAAPDFHRRLQELDARVDRILAQMPEEEEEDDEEQEEVLPSHFQGHLHCASFIGGRPCWPPRHTGSTLA